MKGLTWSGQRPRSTASDQAGLTSTSGLSIPYILTGPDRVPLLAPSSTDKTLTAAGA